MGALAHEWYGRPSDELTIIAVTGTNGKTSATHWLAESLNTSGVPCASIGTLGVCLPKGERIMQSLTTPDVFTMHESLARIRDAKINLVVREASSVDLDQGRLDGVAIDVAAFTDLSHDHFNSDCRWHHDGAI